MTQRPLVRTQNRILGGLALCLALSLGAVGTANAAEYAVDTSHTSVVFKVRHAGVSDVFGQLRQADGKFTYDPAAPEKSTFDLTAKIDSIDTNNAKRDEHLKSPDFFSAKEFPTITFKSKSAKLNGKKLDVTGDLTLHGVTKSVTLSFETGVTEFPKGTPRAGFTTELAIKRSDFGMKGMIGPVGDDIHLYISFEGTAAK